MDNLTHDEAIKNDIIWLKNILKPLTNYERCLILEEYDKLAKEHAISIKEYNAIVNVFNELKEPHDRSN